MKKLLTIVFALLLTGCGVVSEQSSSPEISEAPPVERTFKENDVIFIATNVYDENYLYDVLTINASGEVRTCREPSANTFKGDWISVSEDMKALEPVCILNEQEAETLVEYVSRIDPSSEWIKEEHDDYPEALNYHINYYTIVDGEPLHLFLHYYYTDYLDDENAVAASEYISSHRLEWQSSENTQ